MAVTNNVADVVSRWEGSSVAFVIYRRDRDRIVLIHTEVPLALSSKGVGSRLAHDVLEGVAGCGCRAASSLPPMCSGIPSIRTSWLRRRGKSVGGPSAPSAPIPESAKRRAALQAEIAAATGLDEATLERVVRSFFAAAREDALLALCSPISPTGRRTSPTSARSGPRSP